MIILNLIFLMLTTNANTLNINFGGDHAANDWFIVNDGVMGGKSQSELSSTEESLLFQGIVSLENNGGFASIRSPYATFDLSSYKSVTIRYKSSGQDMGFVLAPHRVWYYPKYKAILKQTDNEWQSSSFNLLDFEEYRIGRLTGEMASADILKTIIRLGFITDNKKTGPFQFEIDFIRFE